MRLPVIVGVCSNVSTEFNLFDIDNFHCGNLLYTHLRRQTFAGLRFARKIMGLLLRKPGIIVSLLH